jgi:hypothetical protein
MKTRQYTPAMTKEEIEKTARDLKKSAQTMIPPKGD